tara:strand:- start:216 stop:416 length:201 start_codon:yes stop_codon:yes gene_type:complete
MLGIDGYKTKKELKESIGAIPRFIETSIFGDEYKGDGVYTVVGPNPRIRNWFAEIKIVNGRIAKVS